MMLTESTRLPGDRLAVLRTDGTQHAIHVLQDRERWVAHHAWAGPEVASLCHVDGQVAWVDHDGCLSWVSKSKVETFDLPDMGHVTGACNLGPRSLLFGGTQGLAFFDTATDLATKRRLRDYGIRKPGRDVLNVCRAGSRVFLLGRNRLVLELQGEACVEHTAPGRRADTTFAAMFVAIQESVVWLSGLFGTRPRLARLNQGELEFADDLALSSAPHLVEHEGQIYTGCETVFASSGRGWEEQLVLSPGDHAVVLEQIAGVLYVVTEQGHCHCLDQRAWRYLGTVQGE